MNSLYIFAEKQKLGQLFVYIFIACVSNTTEASEGKKSVCENVHWQSSG